MQSLSSLLSRSKYIYLISILGILVSVAICSGYFSSIYAKKLESYEDIIIIDPELTFQPVASKFGFPTGMTFLGPDGYMYVVSIELGKIFRILPA